jgi:hypothetical protein
MNERRTCEALLRALRIARMLPHRGGGNVPRVCKGHMLLARDSMQGLRKTAQMGGPPEQEGQQPGTGIVNVGHGKYR